LTSGKAILFVALSVIGGYAVLQASDFAFFNHLSDLVMATMAVSAFFALFFLRALMMLFKPRFIFGEQREALFNPPVVASRGAAREAPHGRGAAVCGAARGLAVSSTSYAAPDLSARDMMEKNFFVSKIKSIRVPRPCSS